MLFNYISTDPLYISIYSPLYLIYIFYYSFHSCRILLAKPLLIYISSFSDSTKSIPTTINIILSFIKPFSLSLNLIWSFYPYILIKLNIIAFVLEFVILVYPRFLLSLDTGISLFLLTLGIGTGRTSRSSFNILLLSFSLSFTLII